MTPDSAWYQPLDRLADAFNPALTLLALAAPKLRESWRGWPAALRYLAAGLGGLAIVYGVAAIDARAGLWSARDLDYSTHTAYAVSLATTILAWDRRWTKILLPALAGYGLLILFLGYHGLADVLTAAAVAAPGSWAAARFCGLPARRG